MSIIQALGRGCSIAKAGLKDAFWILPIHPSDYRLLGFSWQDKIYYDRALPMGCSVSCRVFEELSKSIEWILINKFQVSTMSHILDDFIFFGANSDPCSRDLKKFFILAKSLNLPIKDEKTVQPTTIACLHGIDVDTVVICDKYEVNINFCKLK